MKSNSGKRICLKQGRIWNEGSSGSTLRYPRGTVVTGNEAAIVSEGTQCPTEERSRRCPGTEGLAKGESRGSLVSSTPTSWLSKGRRRLFMETDIIQGPGRGSRGVGGGEAGPHERVLVLSSLPVTLPWTTSNSKQLLVWTKYNSFPAHRLWTI